MGKQVASRRDADICWRLVLAGLDAGAQYSDVVARCQTLFSYPWLGNRVPQAPLSTNTVNVKLSKTVRRPGRITRRSSNAGENDK